MNSRIFVETIPVAALSEATPKCLAIIINTTGDNSIVNSLNNLYPQSQYKIYHIQPGINQLTKTLEICKQLKIKSLILCGDSLPDLSTIVPQSDFSAALISSGSNSNSGKILDYILDCEHVSDFSHIAFQLYKYNPEKLKRLRDRFFEDMRLGTIRGEIAWSEPLIRAKEHFFIDMSSVRSSDFIENKEKSPNGLYAEEICQLGRYIGMSQYLETCYIYGFPTKFNSKSSSAELIAELIWHIAEACTANIYEDPENSETDDFFMRKIVSMGQEGQDLVFITSATTSRWWIEVPNIKTGKNQYVACSYSDYQTAYSGEIPMRWLFFYQKINPV